MPPPSPRLAPRFVLAFLLAASGLAREAHAQAAETAPGAVAGPDEAATEAVQDATEEAEDGGWFDDADDNDPARASRPAKASSSLPARTTPRAPHAGARRPTPHFSVNSSMRVSVKDQITKAFSVSYASLGAALGWQQRESNVTTADYTRWVLSPQLNFKVNF